MYDNSRAPLAAWLMACALLLPAALPAQTATPGASGAAAQPESAGLQEVVVTARRRSENLQDVPITVSAVTASTIEALDITNLQDLNSLVPNLKISQDRATSSTINIYIRGVGQSDPLWGFEPGVGVYVDDVYMARPQAALLDVLDVNRIEVLSGPQGTLYGKNTIAGALKYVTRDIAGPDTATASVTAGNYNERDFKFNGSAAMVPDHVYLGLAIGYFQHDGYGEVLEQPGVAPGPTTQIGAQVSDKDVLVGRANLTFTWGESSKLRLVADGIEDNSHASGGQRLNNYLVAQLSNPFDMYNDMPVNRDFFHRNGYSGTYTQSLTSQLDLKVVAAYYQGNGQQFINFDHLDQNLFEVPGLYKDDQSSGEAQLTFHNDLVKAVGGLFYMNSTACGSYNASIGTLTLLGVPAFDLYITELVTGCVHTKSEAVYGDTSWKLTDKLNFDAGVRWNQDRKSAPVYQADYASVAPTQLYPGQTFFNPSQVPAGFFPFPGVVTDYTGDRTFSNTSPRLGFDYHWTDRLMTYISYSKGFKSGGFDMRGNAAVYPGTENGYNSETADNYEIGLKSTWLDGTLLVNMAVFYDPYTDAQIGVQQFVTGAGGAPTNLTAILNAGKQINQGAELQSVWQPVRALTLTLNTGYLDSYYEDYLIPCSVFTAAPGCAGGVGSINAAAENRPLNAPSWTVSAAALYHWDVQRGTVTARAGYDWRSFTKVANTTPSVTDQPAYGLLNAGLAFETSDARWRVSLDGKNLANKYYRVAGYDFGDPPISPANSYIGGISQIGFYGPPRTYAVTVQYHY
ncbi:MAG TPA: TonB-dependent receptor [Steroidobacteraceae bacterium]|nr:TonB-dependent receptor [Steroidobacteraceae bacterium]